MSAIAKHSVDSRLSTPPLGRTRAMETLGEPSGDALESGDRMNADEFMRLYERSPDIKKAELIQGVVYVASPVRADAHGEPDAVLQYWLGTYWFAHQEFKHYLNTTLRLGKNMVYQPDGMLCLAPAPGRVLALDADGYLRGVPELVVEITASSRKIDLGLKKAGYLKAGVPEYLVWRTLDHAFDWFVLEGGKYQSLEPDAAGVLRSRVFPGLALDAPAALRGDLKRMIATLRREMKKARRP